MRLAAAAKIAWAIGMLLIGVELCHLVSDVKWEVLYLEELVKGVRTNTSEHAELH